MKLYRQKHEELNAFFSGSVKVEEATDPLRFPANLHKSHGKELNPQN